MAALLGGACFSEGGGSGGTDGCESGTEDCPCLVNLTCLGDLECRNGLCLQPEDGTDAATATATATDATSDSTTDATTTSAGTSTTTDSGTGGSGSSTGGVEGLVVFVTEVAHQGDLGGLFGADDKCQAEAAASGLTGTFLAWISTSTDDDPEGRFMDVPGLPYVRVDGEIVADSLSALLSGGPDFGITKTAGGGNPNSALDGFGVWTGTGSDGVNTGIACDGFASAAGSASGTSGLFNSSSAFWTNESEDPCDEYNFLYCFEQAP